MPIRIGGTGFGYIIVNGARYNSDIIVCSNSVKTRPKYLSKRYRERFNHTPLSREELDYILSVCGNPEAIVIGTGQYGALPIMDSARELLDSLRMNDVEVLIDKTPKVIDKVNELLSKGVSVLAIIHVTC